MERRSARRLPVALAATLAAAAALAALLASIASAAERPHGLDALVSLGVQLLGAALLGWYVLTGLAGLVVLASRAAGSVWTTGEAAVQALGAPVLKRVTLIGAGAAVAACSIMGPAIASPPPDPAPTVTADLGWGAAQSDDAGGGEADVEGEADPEESSALGLTDEVGQAETVHPPTSPAGSGWVESAPESPESGPEGSADERSGDATDSALAGGEAQGPAEGPAEGTAEGPAHDAHVVVEGDTLWAIVAARLPGAPTDAEISDAWPRWYDQNREVIGADPDLIHPGQVLSAPSGTADAGSSDPTDQEASP